MMKAVYHFGRYLMLLRMFFESPEKFKIYWRLTMQEIVAMGIGSVSIVFIISVFIGAVTTVQTAYQLVSNLVPKSTIGAIVSTSAILELAPTILSLVLAGKIGSHIAGELGTMRVTEQIDALEVMGINSASYLILPKIIGAMIAFPCLVIFSCFLTHIGGIIAGDMTGEVTAAQFGLGAREFFEPFQVTFMLIKAVTFGFVISSISAYQGFYVKGGALEVGRSSTLAVVYSCIFVVFCDYILAQLLL
ncbi:MAG: ABC transporter permease [Bacteroidia bacterium]|nr:ABC transporter permease [Bacteroidia bacterium]